MKDAEWSSGFRFEIIAEDSSSRARLGKLTTPHGVIHTPAFMPVGTYGAVKGLAPVELRQTGAEIILANALHLEFRPGSQTVAELGGIHRLMGWSGPILTDSGGFQTYSLAGLMKQDNAGIEIRSPVDGARHTITPERVIAIQRNLGTDFMMPLDVCAPGKADQSTIRSALERTLHWAKRSKEAYCNSSPVQGKPQALFGIVQGGIDENCRKAAVEALLDIGFFGYAIGGLAVGEAKQETWRIVALCDQLLPRDKPRYLMGVGTPEDLQKAISLGMDFFDCVLPTRNGRKGSLFVRGGKINVRNARFKADPLAIEEGCSCPACQRGNDGIPVFSRGALRHLLTSGDPLGARLGALHNLTFYFRTLAEIRSRVEI